MQLLKRSGQVHDEQRDDLHFIARTGLEPYYPLKSYVHELDSEMKLKDKAG